MRPRLSSGQVFGLYALAVGFLFLFYVMGLFVGRHYFVEGGSPHENVPGPQAPLGDVKSQLEFYQQDWLRGPSSSAEGSGPPSVLPADPALQPGVGEEPGEIEEPPAPFEIYTIQVAAVRREQDARQILLRLEAKGYAARLQPPRADPYYRVLVGEFATQGEAQEIQSRLRDDGFSTFLKKVSLGRTSELPEPRGATP